MQWKPIKNYEGLYEVSNTGLVRSVDRIDCVGKRQKGKILRLNNTEKYLRVVLCKDGTPKTFYIHRLVAITFISNEENYKCVNHKDGNKLNNNVENLEWCTYSHNMKHAFSNGLAKPWNKKLFDKDIKRIVSLKGHISGKKVAKDYSVSAALIYQIWKTCDIQ